MPVWCIRLGTGCFSQPRDGHYLDSSHSSSAYEMLSEATNPGHRCNYFDYLERICVMVIGETLRIVVSTHRGHRSSLSL